MAELREEIDDGGAYRRNGKVLEAAIDELETISTRSERLSEKIGLATVSNFIAFFLTVVSAGSKLFGFHALGGEMAVIIVVVVPALWIVVLHLLQQFEKSVRTGNIFYQEISDVMEWDKVDSVFRFKIRTSMRRFVASTTLPFYREGSNGPAFYLAINAIFASLVIVSVIVLTK